MESQVTPEISPEEILELSPATVERIKRYVEAGAVFDGVVTTFVNWALAAPENMSRANKAVFNYIEFALLLPLEQFRMALIKILGEDPWAPIHFKLSRIECNELNIELTGNDNDNTWATAFLAHEGCHRRMKDVEAARKGLPDIHKGWLLTMARQGAQPQPQPQPQAEFLGRPIRKGRGKGKKNKAKTFSIQFVEKDPTEVYISVPASSIEELQNKVNDLQQKLRQAQGIADRMIERERMASLSAEIEEKKKNVLELELNLLRRKFEELKSGEAK